MNKIENIRSLIEIINSIGIKKDEEKFSKIIINILIHGLFFMLCSAGIIHYFLTNSFYLLILAPFIHLFYLLLMILIEDKEDLVLKLSNRFVSNILFKKYIKNFNKEEIQLINIEKDNFINLISVDLEKEKYLVLLLDKYIENLETVNIENFLKLYKEINLSKENFNMLTNKLFNKFISKNKLVTLIYANFKYLETPNDFSSAEKLIYYFLKENNEFKEKLLKNNIDYILDNSELKDILRIPQYRESLSLKQLILKLKKKYNLKEIVENIFIKVEKNENEIQKIYNLLDIEQKMLFKKEIIEDILELKDENIIENCSDFFLNYAANLELKNKDLLCLMKDKIYFKKQSKKEEIKVINEKIKIINI